MSRGFRMIATVAAISIASMSVAQAAFVENIVGDVKVDFGQGFVPVTTPASLKAGDRVMVGASSSAQIQYPGGCFTIVPVGNVVTVGAENACALAEQAAQSGTTGGTGSAPVIIGGVALIGGAAIVIASKKSSSSP